MIFHPYSGDPEVAIKTIISLASSTVYEHSVSGVQYGYEDHVALVPYNSLHCNHCHSDNQTNLNHPRITQWPMFQVWRRRFFYSQFFHTYTRIYMRVVRGTYPTQKTCASSCRSYSSLPVEHDLDNVNHKYQGPTCPEISR